MYTTYHKALSYTLIGSIILTSISGCSSPTPTTQDQRTPFYITVQNANTFPTIASITKPGRVVGSQEITVTSQAMGRIENILTDDGRTVAGGQPVIQLRDSIANYASQVDRTKNALDRAILQYEQTSISLDKSIQDAQNALDQSKNAFSIAQRASEQNIKKSFQDLQNADYTTGNSAAKLTIEKAITDINNQLSTLKNQLGIEQTNIINAGEDITQFVDPILGVTEKYRLKNDLYEIYLSANKLSAKTQAETQLVDIYNRLDALRSLNTTNPSTQIIKTTIDIYIENYNAYKLLLQTMQDVFKNSVVTTTLTQPTLDLYISTADSLQSKIQASVTALTNYKNQVQSLMGDVYFSSGDDTSKIRTLAEQQISILIKNSDINKSNAEISYETTRINMENTLFNAELAVKNAQLNYDTLARNQNIQLSLIENTINDARIAYQDAQRQYSKLTARSPIGGKIAEIFVDEGQEVSVGTPLFSVVSANNQMVEIYVSADEVMYMQVGKQVMATYNNSQYPGRIAAVSSVADKNTQYKVTIGLDKPLNLIGDVIDVIIPIDVSRRLLPINTVTSLNDSNGFIYILKNNVPTEYDVKFGKTWGNMIEITSILPGSMKIITSDMSNYDKTKFELFLVQTGNNSIVPSIIPLGTGSSTGTKNQPTENQSVTEDIRMRGLPEESVTSDKKDTISGAQDKDLEKDAEQLLNELLGE